MRRVAPLMTALAIVMASASCYVWRVETVPENSSEFKALGDEVQVTLKDGTVVTLLDAGVQKDSVIGRLASSKERMAYPVREVQSVRSWRHSGRRTAGLIVGVGAAFLTVFFIAIASFLTVVVVD